MKNKFAKAKERKNRYGRIGLLLLLGGLVSLFITDVFFGLAIIFCAAFGFIGVLEDEDKRAAWVALLLPIVSIIALLIYFGIAIGD